MAAAAKNITRQASSSAAAPAIVMDDADLELAVKAAVDLRTNTGRCVTASRAWLHVQQGIYDRFRQPPRWRR